MPSKSRSKEPSLPPAADRTPRQQGGSTSRASAREAEWRRPPHGG
jgi:hypothetical protein